jgi:RNA 3'-terminal phosphate cyclase (ATP)
LVLQTILLPLTMADQPSVVQVTGGTHNEQAPPFEFLDRSFGRVVRSMGGQLKLAIDRYGFFPAGGGVVRATITPSTLSPLNLLTRGPTRHRAIESLIANLERHIAEREIEQVLSSLGWPQESGKILHVNSPAPGNALLATLESDEVTEVIVEFGKIGVRAEHLAKSLARSVKSYLASQVPVGEHLADQLLLPFALAGGGSFLTGPLSLHARTNMAVIKQLLGVGFRIEEPGHRQTLVTVG